jgi:hypothetical protein
MTRHGEQVAQWMHPERAAFVLQAQDDLCRVRRVVDALDVHMAHSARGVIEANLELALADLRDPQKRTAFLGQEVLTLRGRLEDAQRGRDALIPALDAIHAADAELKGARFGRRGRSIRRAVEHLRGPQDSAA